ncbi:MFS transporter, partial [Bacillus vallismortis]|nr:MFS transporter [Bacillus vallismortis]
VGYGYAAVGLICAAITMLGFVLSVFAYKKYGKHEQKADRSLFQ